MWPQPSEKGGKSLEICCFGHRFMAKVDSIPSQAA